MKTFDGQTLILGIDTEMIVMFAGKERYIDVRTEVLREFARDYTEVLLAKTSGNVVQAAKLAGTDRSAFYRLIRRGGFRPRSSPPIGDES